MNCFYNNLTSKIIFHVHQYHAPARLVREIEILLLVRLIVQHTVSCDEHIIYKKLSLMYHYYLELKCRWRGISMS